MLLESVRSEGLAHHSYDVGDAVQAAVSDPCRNCGIYPEIPSGEGARIAHIFEPHHNEDYVVGSRDLANRSGAEIYHGSALPFGYGLPVSEGDRFEFGKLVLSVPKTPGHPDECISLVFADTAVSEGSNDP